MPRALAAAACALAACSAPAAPVAPAAPPPAVGPGGAVAAPPPVDAREPSEDERLAAIQKAMNELDEAAQGCWAAAAVERFDIAGELVATIAIAGPGRADVAFARDTTRTPALAACVARVLAGYAWAPPLHGQTIQLPFRFRAPDGQSVIDRALVPWHGQGKLALAVLADARNTGNPAASIVELAIAAGGATGMRVAERDELWYFLAPMTVHAPGAAGLVAVEAGDLMFVPAGGARDVAAAADAHAVIAIVPGGPEGAARAGALPTRELGASRVRAKGPIHLRAAAATRRCLGGGDPARGCPRGAVTIFAEPSTIHGRTLAASILELPAGASVPAHVHAHETELLYVLSGSGTLTVGDSALPVTATSVIQIPPNTTHAFTTAAPVRALQIYTPQGPEQRFKASPP